MASEDYKESEMSKIVKRLMDEEGFEFGEAVREAMEQTKNFESKADGGSIGIEVLFTDKMANGGRVPAVSGGFLKLLAEGAAKGKQGIMELVESGKSKFDDFVETQVSKKPSDSFTSQNITADLIDGPITVEKMANLDSKTLNIIKNTYDQGLYKEMPEILKAGNLLERFTKVVKGERIIDYERAEAILGVSLKGDETLNDLFKIEFNTRPVEKLADGGRVGLFMGGPALEGQALSIYNSMKGYGATDQAIADRLGSMGLYDPNASTPDTPQPVKQLGYQGSDNFSPYNPDPNRVKAFKEDVRVMPAMEALQRNQQLTSMGIEDPFANEASLDGAYYGDMFEDTSNQVGPAEVSGFQKFKNTLSSAKTNLLNNPLTNAIGFAMNPAFGVAKGILGGLKGIIGPNQRAITENIAGNMGIRVNDIGQIVNTRDYNTPEGVMAGYNLNKIDQGTFDKRYDRIEKTLADKYGFTEKEIEDVIAGTYTGPKGINKTTGKFTTLADLYRNVQKANKNILDIKNLGIKEAERIRKEKQRQEYLESQTRKEVQDLQKEIDSGKYSGGSDFAQSNQAAVGGGNTAKNAQGQTAAQATAAGTGTSQGYSQHYARGGLATMFTRRR